jgi:hypothetical protein
MDEKPEFAERLKAAMAAAGHEPRPAVLEKQFNSRYPGRSVTFQAVRGCLIPSTFAAATGRELDREALWQAFIDMGHVPQLTRSLVERMALNPTLDLNIAKTALVKEINQDRDYNSEWGKCSVLERLLLLMIAGDARVRPPRIGIQTHRSA